MRPTATIKSVAGKEIVHAEAEYRNEPFNKSDSRTGVADQSSVLLGSNGRVVAFINKRVACGPCGGIVSNLACTQSGCAALDETGHVGPTRFADCAPRPARGWHCDMPEERIEPLYGRNGHQCGEHVSAAHLSSLRSGPACAAFGLTSPANEPPSQLQISIA